MIFEGLKRSDEEALDRRRFRNDDDHDAYRRIDADANVQVALR